LREGHVPSGALAVRRRALELVHFALFVSGRRLGDAAENERCQGWAVRGGGYRIVLVRSSVTFATSYDASKSGDKHNVKTKLADTTKDKYCTLG
jgi:hypothetical protein